MEVTLHDVCQQQNASLRQTFNKTNKGALKTAVQVQNSSRLEDPSNNPLGLCDCSVLGLSLATPGTFPCVDFKPIDCLYVDAKPSVISGYIWILCAADLNSLCSKTEACMEVTLHDVCQHSKMLN